MLSLFRSYRITPISPTGEGIPRRTDTIREGTEHVDLRNGCKCRKYRRIDRVSLSHPIRRKIHAGRRTARVHAGTVHALAYCRAGCKVTLPTSRREILPSACFLPQDTRVGFGFRVVCRFVVVLLVVGCCYHTPILGKREYKQSVPLYNSNNTYYVSTSTHIFLSFSL